MPMYAASAVGTGASTEDVQWMIRQLQNVMPELNGLGWNVNIDFSNGPDVYSVTGRAIFNSRGEANRVKQQVARILQPVYDASAARGITWTTADEIIQE